MGVLTEALCRILICRVVPIALVDDECSVATTVEHSSTRLAECDIRAATTRRATGTVSITRYISDTRKIALVERNCSTGSTTITEVDVSCIIRRSSVTIDSDVLSTTISIELITQETANNGTLAIHNIKTCLFRALTTARCVDCATVSLYRESRVGSTIIARSNLPNKLSLVVNLVDVVVITTVDIDIAIIVDCWGISLDCILANVVCPQEIQARSHSLNIEYEVEILVRQHCRLGIHYGINSDIAETHRNLELPATLDDWSNTCLQYHIARESGALIECELQNLRSLLSCNNLGSRIGNIGLECAYIRKIGSN